ATAARAAVGGGAVPRPVTPVDVGVGEVAAEAGEPEAELAAVGVGDAARVGVAGAELADPNRRGVRLPLPQQVAPLVAELRLERRLRAVVAGDAVVIEAVVVR